MTIQITTIQKLLVECAFWTCALLLILANGCHPH